MTGTLLPSGLATPATMVFADRLERNLAVMAAFAADAGIALRPHAKTHKCRQIARRQMSLGARGLTVATVGEAAAMIGPAEAGQSGPGVADVFIAYPLWPAGDLIGRLADLASQVQITVAPTPPRPPGGRRPWPGGCGSWSRSTAAWPAVAWRRPMRPVWPRRRSRPAWR